VVIDVDVQSADGRRDRGSEQVLAERETPASAASWCWERPARLRASGDEVLAPRAGALETPFVLNGDSCTLRHNDPPARLIRIRLYSFGMEASRAQRE
jgi:hypothetical protein